MQQQLTRMRGSWTALPSRAQFAIVGVIAVTMLVMFFVLRAATATEWVPVASNLTADKLGQAETALDEAGIDHRLTADRASIEVPDVSQPKAANALVALGIAAKSSRATCSKAVTEGGGMIAETSAQHALKLETCEENQTANMLEGIDGVTSASVDVSLPEATLFSDEARSASASVALNTGGSELPKKTYQGMQEMVAAAFSKNGLKKANVTITDETGQVRAGSSDMDAQLASMSKLDAEARVNAKIERDLLSQIEKIVGVGNAVITSNVSLDMDQIQREVIHTDPAGEDGTQLVESENVKRELLNGSADTGTEGVAGVGSNTGAGVDTDNRTTTPTDTTDSDDGDNYVKDDRQTIYANNKVAEKIGVAPGTVKLNRLGVVVDDDVDADSANAVKDVVQAWMGGNSADSLAFNQAPIAAAVPAKAAASARNVSAIMGYVKWGLLGLGLIGLAFVLRRSLTQRTAELLAPADDLLLLERDFTPIPIAELEAALAANEPSAERRGRLEVQKKVEGIAAAKPQDVANELRRWMHQDDPGYAGLHRKAG
ncbi:MAG: fliF [Thermoleophilia bacterium]|nr:fliF [Thermoleophilia bacterium]